MSRDEYVWSCSVVARLSWFAKSKAQSSYQPASARHFYRASAVHFLAVHFSASMAGAGAEGKAPKAKGAEGKAPAKGRKGVSANRTPEQKSHQNALDRINHYINTKDSDARAIWRKASRDDKKEWVKQYTASGFAGLTNTYTTLTLVKHKTVI